MRRAACRNAYDVAREALRCLGVLAAAALLVSHSAEAQTYPSRPLRLVVPFPGGGPADQFARILADRLSQGLGQSVVVFPKEGGGTVIGVDFVAKSSPDGYTLLLASDAAAINSASGRKLPYDLLRDLRPVSLILRSRQVLVTGPSTPWSSLKDLIATARANPGKVSYATSGVGTAVHLATERFRSAAGITITHVPYKGVAPAMVDLIGGRVDMLILSLGFAGQHIAAGKVRALGIAEDKRYDRFPDIPTFREQGVDYTSHAWYGVLVPRATPAAIVARLSDEIGKALADPDLRKRIAATAAEPMPSSPGEFERFLREDIARYEAVIRANNVQFN